MDIRKVKKLIEMMEESDIREIEIREGEESVRISRGGVVLPVSAVDQSMNSKDRPSRVSEPGVGAVRGHIVHAPMVGTFYRAPSPSSPPYVEIGDRVKEGETLCIIESMKMMNHIKADQTGVIEAILVANDEPVEFDQPLFTIV